MNGSTPVYFVTGFLDSGKTTFIKETLMEQDWIKPGLTLLIICEEGEEEYSGEYLKRKNMELVCATDIEQMAGNFFKNCDEIYHPSQIVIEYNGMWKVNRLLSAEYPRYWELHGVYSMIDGITLDMYLANMRNLLMEQLVESELIIVNRSVPGTNRTGFYRAMKIQNPAAQLVFKDSEGTVIHPLKEELPFDVNTDVISIRDEDFGIWYVDAGEHPDYYLEKEIQFAAKALHPRGMNELMFIPAREIMTCCAEDISFYGYPCKLSAIQPIPQNQWIRISAEFAYEALTPSGKKQPVLYLKQMILAAKPEDEFVYLI